MANGHGGKRDGAGRNPKLSQGERYRIGALCELLQQSTSEKATKEAFDRKFSLVQSHSNYQELVEMWEALHSIPIRYRKSVTKLESDEDLAVGADELPFEVEEGREVLAGVRALLDGDTNDPEAPEPIGRSTTVNRKRGFTRRQVIEQVRIDLAKEGVVVRASFIERCWNEFRKIESGHWILT